MKQFPVCLPPVRVLPAKLHLAQPPLRQGSAAAVTIQQYASLHDQTLLIQAAFNFALEMHCVAQVVQGTTHVLLVYAASSVTPPVIAAETCDKSPCCLHGVLHLQDPAT